MDFRHMIVIYGIPDMQNPAGNRPMQLFIDSQGFMGIYDLPMLRIKELTHMIKDHNLFPNKESHLDAIQQHRLQVLVWWAKNCHSHGLEIMMTAWNEEYLTSSITQINIESPLGGEIKVAHPGEMETGHKWTT